MTFSTTSKFYGVNVNSEGTRFWKLQENVWTTLYELKIQMVIIKTTNWSKNIFKFGNGYTCEERFELQIDIIIVFNIYFVLAIVYKYVLNVFSLGTSLDVRKSFSLGRSDLLCCPLARADQRALPGMGMAKSFIWHIFGWAHAQLVLMYKNEVVCVYMCVSQPLNTLPDRLSLI